MECLTAEQQLRRATAYELCVPSSRAMHMTAFSVPIMLDIILSQICFLLVVMQMAHSKIVLVCRLLWRMHCHYICNYESEPSTKAPNTKACKCECSLIRSCDVAWAAIRNVAVGWLDVSLRKHMLTFMLAVWWGELAGEVGIGRWPNGGGGG